MIAALTTQKGMWQSLLPHDVTGIACVLCVLDRCSLPRLYAATMPVWAWVLWDVFAEHGVRIGSKCWEIALSGILGVAMPGAHTSRRTFDLLFHAHDGSLIAELQQIDTKFLAAFEAFMVVSQLALHAMAVHVLCTEFINTHCSRDF
jgi:hypothetical protein